MAVDVVAPSPLPDCLLEPKSMSVHFPNRSMRMFPGFMSICHMEWTCMDESASSIWLSTSITTGSENGDS